jgi:hypothetical protein
LESTDLFFAFPSLLLDFFDLQALLPDFLDQTLFPHAHLIPCLLLQLLDVLLLPQDPIEFLSNLLHLPKLLELMLVALLALIVIHEHLELLRECLWLYHLYRISYLILLPQLMILLNEHLLILLLVAA